eukprot:gene8894-9631_t
MNILSTEFFSNHVLLFLDQKSLWNFIYINHAIYDQLNREIRQVRLNTTDLIEFIQNNNFQEFIFSRIQSSKKQLIVHEDETNELEMEDPFITLIQIKSATSFDFPSLHRLVLKYSSFVALLSSYPSVEVEYLELYDNEPSFDGSFFDVNVAPLLKAAKKGIHLKQWRGGSFLPLTLSETLEIISLSHCADPINLPASSLPQLRYLILEDSPITNFHDFSYLKRIEIVGRLDWLNLAKIDGKCQKLKLSGSSTLVDLTHINTIPDVTIFECHVKSYVAAFQHTKSLSIRLLPLHDDQSDTSIDLTNYPSLEYFELDADSNKLTSLMTGDLPKQLKTVKLSLIPNPIDLFCFYSLRAIYLNNCDGITHLHGLFNVPRVYITNLQHLTSLEGLESNKYVQVTCCQNLTDFSAVKHVYEVQIEDCQQFINAIDVDHVERLTISRCYQIEDLSKLSHVKVLYLRSLPQLTSLESIEGKILSLHIYDCLNLQPADKKLEALLLRSSTVDNNHNNKDYQHSFHKIIDILYHEIFAYLIYDDILSFFSCNLCFFQNYSKKYREINLQYRLYDFLTCLTFRKRILLRIENPLKQLSIRGEQILNKDLDKYNQVLSSYSFREVIIRAIVFYDLFLKQQHTNPHSSSSMMKRLVLFENRAQAFPITEESFINGIRSMVSESLVFFRCSFPLDSHVQFSSTLLELQLQHCGTILLSPLLPHLKTLVLQSTNIQNMKDFSYVPNVIIESSQLDDLTPYNHIRRLTLKNCLLSNINGLKENREIIIEQCQAINDQPLDCSQSFQKTKKLTLDVLIPKLVINLSNALHLETCTIKGLGITSLQSQLLFSGDSLPLSLKTLTIRGLDNLPNFTTGFDHLQRLEIIGCKGIQSLKAFGKIPVIKFTMLLDCESLDGLGRGNQDVSLVTITMNKKVKDFTPLQKVEKVSIVGCDGLTDGSQLGEVKHLTLKRCNYLKSLAGMNKIHHLEIIECNEAEFHVDLLQIPSLIIHNCKKMEDVNSNSYE